MKRSTPFFSPISLVIAAVVFISLALTLWVSGGLGFNPGPVSEKSVAGVTLQGFASHADFEKECYRCHQPLKGEQAILCLDCHTDIAGDRAARVGYHGRLDPAEPCFGCHSEHQGRAFDPINLDIQDFDHSVTNFPLQGEHLELACDGCHTTEGYRLGTQACRQCHPEPDLHAGMFGQDCESCHTEEGWETVLIDGQPFDHERLGFSLEEHSEDFDDNPIRCDACHQGSGPADINTACIDCHAADEGEFISEHRRQFGDTCLECHNGSDGYAGFDHAQIFPLEGEHASVDCVECHTDRVFEGTPRQCEACHAEPAAHVNMFGKDCAACHTAAGWLPALLDGSPFDHEQMTFRLVKHKENFDDTPIECTSCHLGLVDEIGSEGCVQCHSRGQAEFTARHQREFGTNCLACHDGVDRFSNFNHATFFALRGQHAGLACSSCHANLVFAGVPQHCAGCHGEPAYHSGVFGVQCQECHSENAWTPASMPGHDFPLDHGESGRLDCRVCHPSTLATYTCAACHDGNPEGDGGGEGGGGDDD